MKRLSLLAILLIALSACSHSHHKDSSISHNFSDAEKWSKVFDDPSRDEWQKPIEVAKLMDIKEGSWVADIGAGTGYFLPHLQNKVGELKKQNEEFSKQLWCQHDAVCD